MSTLGEVGAPTGLPRRLRRALTVGALRRSVRPWDVVADLRNNAERVGGGTCRCRARAMWRVAYVNPRGVRAGEALCGACFARARSVFDVAERTAPGIALRWELIGAPRG